MRRSIRLESNITIYQCPGLAAFGSMTRNRAQIIQCQYSGEAVLELFAVMDAEIEQLLNKKWIFAELAAV